MSRALIAAVALVLLAPVPASAQEMHWYKGNTHTHTINSDGDSPPDVVARWYREHGYNFLVLSDHNFLTSVDGINAVLGADGQFILIPGEEVTDGFEGKPIHVNGLAVDRLVEPQGGSSVFETVQRDVDAIRAANGVPHVNHPNFIWAITAEELARIRNTRLFEIFNGHPLTNNQGGGGSPGLEEMWDIILSSGTLLYGIAVDDAHTFKDPGNPLVAGPGRGWVMVRAPRLTAADILASLERGDFYASTGVVLTDVVATPQRYSVTITERRTTKYRVQFIGRDGKLLAERLSSPATYEPDGDEGYVRAVVLDSNGWKAWTQPVLIPAR
jgi:hypothetical protein